MLKGMLIANIAPGLKYREVSSDAPPAQILNRVVIQVDLAGKTIKCRQVSRGSIQWLLDHDNPHVFAHQTSGLGQMDSLRAQMCVDRNGHVDIVPEQCGTSPVTRLNGEFNVGRAGQNKFARRDVCSGNEFLSGGVLAGVEGSCLDLSRIAAFHGSTTFGARSFDFA